MAAEIDRREQPGVRIRPVVAAMLVILGSLIAIAFGLQLVFRDRIGRMHATQSAFPSPEVMADERAERLALEARQRRELAGGNGRMAITAAMQAIAARGRQAFDPIRSGP
jgi:hypothetical protein